MEVVGLLEQPVGEPLELEPDVQGAVVHGVEHALRHRHRQRRMARELADQRVDRAVELVRRDDLRDEPDRERLLGLHPSAAHDDVLRATEPDEAGESLRAARAGDHPDRRLGQRHLEVVGGDPEVARERELEPDAEHVALELRDHGLGAALGRGDVLRELGDDPRRLRQESGDVAAGGELAAGSGEHDEPHRIVPVELGEDLRQLVAREHRDPVELPRHVERDRGDAARRRRARPGIRRTRSLALLRLVAQDPAQDLP